MNINIDCNEIRNDYAKILQRSSIEDVLNGKIENANLILWVKTAYGILEKHKQLLLTYGTQSIQNLSIELKISKENYHFLQDELPPTLGFIEKIVYDNAKKADILDLRDLDYLDGNNKRLYNFICEAVEDKYYDKDNIPVLNKHLYEEDINSIFTAKLYGFEPDLWASRSKELEPVLTRFKNLNENIPSEAMTRLQEIYRSYIYGLWYSVTILCRSALEYSILKKKDKFGIKMEFEKTFSLHQLIEHVSNLIPEVKEEMKIIKENGNNIAHPIKKGSVQVLNANPEKISKESLESTVFVLQKIFSYQKANKSKHSDALTRTGV